ncbi:MAG: hypothetical protein KTR18_02805 [Acidiferrobacterales bacterium]|nr:hypothetical protein [Acidiferrobacterales bacterium]
MRDTERSKRQKFKRMAAGSIAAATATAVMAGQPGQGSLGLESSGITVKVCDEPNGKMVLLSNSSDVARTLVAIQPFKIYTREGAIDLRQLFEQGAVKINEHSTQSFQVVDSGVTNRHANWRALVPTNKARAPAAKLQPVDVVSSVTGETHHNRTRKHLALFA